VCGRNPSYEETASSLAVATGAFPHSKEMVLDRVDELLSGDWNLHFHGFRFVSWCRCPPSMSGLSWRVRSRSVWNTTHLSPNECGAQATCCHRVSILSRASCFFLCSSGFLKLPTMLFLLLWCTILNTTVRFVISKCLAVAFVSCMCVVLHCAEIHL